MLDVIKKVSEASKESKVKMLKTIIIGLSVSEAVEHELKSIATAGGQNAVYLGVDEVDIKEILQKINVIIGLESRRQARALQKSKNKENGEERQVPTDNYAILLNL